MQMKGFLKQWILLILSGLLLILLILYWIFKPVDDVIGADTALFPIWGPVVMEHAVPPLLFLTDAVSSFVSGKELLSLALPLKKRQIRETAGKVAARSSAASRWGEE